MKHKNAIVSAESNKDETQILARSDFFDNGTVHLWFIEVDEAFPERHLPLMVKVAWTITVTLKVQVKENGKNTEQSISA